MSSISLNLRDTAGDVMRLPLAMTTSLPPYKYASHLYPVLVEDNIKVSAAMQGSGILWRNPRDTLVTTANMNGIGELNAIYVEYSLPAEDVLITSANMNGIGELNAIYVEYSLPAEDTLVTTASMDGIGELKAVLIVHDYGKELLTVSAAMNGTGELQ